MGTTHRLATPTRRPQIDDSSGAALVAGLKAEMDAEELKPGASEGELLAIAEALQDRIVEVADAR
jgi:hypothetical protein